MPQQSLALPHCHGQGPPLIRTISGAPALVAGVSLTAVNYSGNKSLIQLGSCGGQIAAAHTLNPAQQNPRYYQWTVRNLCTDQSLCLCPAPARPARAVNGTSRNFTTQCSIYNRQHLKVILHMSTVDNRLTLQTIIPISSLLLVLKEIRKNTIFSESARQ